MHARRIPGRLLPVHVAVVHRMSTQTWMALPIASTFARSMLTKPRPDNAGAATTTLTPTGMGLLTAMITARQTLTSKLLACADVACQIQTQMQMAVPTASMDALQMAQR